MAATIATIYFDGAIFAIPKKSSATAAGYDLFAPCQLEFAPNSTKLVSLCFRIEMPANIYVEIIPDDMGTSLLAHTQIVNSGDPKPIAINFINPTSQQFSVAAGRKIGTLIFHERSATCMHMALK